MTHWSGPKGAAACPQLYDKDAMPNAGAGAEADNSDDRSRPSGGSPAVVSVWSRRKQQCAMPRRTATTGAGCEPPRCRLGFGLREGKPLLP
jgi:hypothetical protein